MAFPLHTHKVFSAGSAVLHRNAPRQIHATSDLLGFIGSNLLSS